LVVFGIADASRVQHAALDELTRHHLVLGGWAYPIAQLALAAPRHLDQWLAWHLGGRNHGIT